MICNNKIKILFLIDQLNPGGSERQLLLLADGLPRSNYEPVIGVLDVTSFHLHENIRTPIVTFTARGLPFVKSLTRIWKIFKYLNKEKFDIVQLYFPTASILGATAVRLSKHRPYLIGTRRNLYHWINQDKIVFWFYRYTTRWVDHIIANSLKVVELSKKYETIPNDKITVIDNGIDIKKYQKVKNETAKKNINIGGEHPVIGVVSNWRHIKGVSVFLDACALVIKSYPTARFVLVGNGPQKPELEQLAKILGINEHIYFIEGRSDVHNIIPAFDIAVQPSLSESFSNVLVEYMASGRSIVATRVGDAERVITNGIEGILVKPNNAIQLSNGIIRLLGDKGSAEKMRLAARKKAEKNWTIEANITAYNNFYQKILQNIDHV